MSRADGDNGSVNKEAGSVDPAAVSDHQSMGIVGPDYWMYAQVKDWILLATDISHVDVRVYAVFRSLATRYRMDRRLSKDQVRFLLPGVNGKPMRTTAFDDSLRRLAKKGLVVIERANVHIRGIQNAQTGKFEQVEQLLFRVHELPQEGKDYDGWHTTQEALEAYPGPGWETDYKFYTRRSNRGRKSGDGSSDDSSANRGRISGEDNSRFELGKQDVSAGKTVGTPNRKSGGTRRKSGDGSRKSGSAKAKTSQKADHHTSLSNVLPDKSSIDAHAYAREASLDPWSPDFVPEPVTDEVEARNDRTIDVSSSDEGNNKPEDDGSLSMFGMSKTQVAALRRMVTQRPEAPQEFVALVAGLPWTRYGKKTPASLTDVKHLAKFAAQMADDGYSGQVISSHLAAALRSCDGRNPRFYLENAMIGDLRPAPTTPATEADYEQDFWGDPLPSSTNTVIEVESAEQIQARLAAEELRRQEQQAAEQAKREAADATREKVMAEARAKRGNRSPKPPKSRLRSKMSA